MGDNLGVKCMYFFEYLLLYSWALIRPTEYIVIMTKKGSTKILNFMTPGTWVLMRRHGHKSQVKKYIIMKMLKDFDL